MRRALPLMVVLCLSAACSKSASTEPAADTTATPAGVAAAPAPQAPPEVPAEALKPVPAQLPDTIARINGEPLSRSEFETAIRDMEQRAGAPIPADQRDRILRGLLDQLVGYKLLVQEGKARRIDVPDADVDARIAAIRQQFPTEDAFTQALAVQGLSLAQMKAEAKQDMVIAKLIDGEIAGRIAVTPADIDAFYKENPQHFQQGEQVHASHILVGQRGMDAAAKAAAKTKAEQILKDARAGKDFATLARENSEDPGSGPNGGDLGFFSQGEMTGPFNDAAFTLAPGALSDLVETEFGYHIIKVLEKKTSRVVPIDEARPQIQQFLEEQNRERQTTAFVDGLRAKGTVELFV